MERYFHSSLATVSFALLCLVTFVGPSRAGDPLDTVSGFISDPLGLKKMSESAERIMIQLQQLEATANIDVTNRLEQVRSILHDAIDGSQTVIDKATQSMLAIEKQVNLDAANLIYNVKCATDVTLLNTAPRAFSDLISTLKKANPGVDILGIRIIDLSINDVQILNPDAAYTSTKKGALQLLEKNVTDLSKANDIFSTYQNLEMSAKFNICYYKGQMEEQDWIQEANDLERLSIPWRTVVVTDKDYTP